MKRAKAKWLYWLTVLSYAAILFFTYNISKEPELVQFPKNQVESSDLSMLRPKIAWKALSDRETYNKQASSVALDRELYDYAIADKGDEQEKAIEFYDNWVLRRFGIHPEQGKVFTEDRTAFTDSRQYVNVLMTFLNRGLKPLTSEEYRAWMDVRDANRGVKMKLARIKPRTGLIWKRDKTPEEIDKELADYDAKMLGRHFIIAYKVFDDVYHFNEEEKEVIRAALRNGKGLPRYMDGAYLLATGGDLKRMEIINRMVDLSRERNSNWWLDNIIFPFSNCIRDVYDKIQILVAKSVVIDIYKREVCEEITNSAYPDFFYWNKDESNQFGDGYSGKEREKMIAVVNKLCAMRLVKESNPYAQYLNEYRQQITLRNACSYKPTFVYYVQIGEWKGIAALVFCLFITIICIVICWTLARRCAIPIKS